MPKKRPDFRSNAGNPFGESEENGSTPDNSVAGISSQIFGSTLEKDIKKADERAGERVRPIDIFTLLPDKTQPRRAMPSRIRRMWDQTPEGIAEALFLWWRETEEERGEEFDLHAHLMSKDTQQKDDAPSERQTGPVETAFLELVNLAASIHRDGLINPVTVVRNPNRYQEFLLETGERRWLAYHLLHTWFNSENGLADEREQWKAIPAREVKQVDVWRQATENNARAALNAVGRARQWAILMMDLHDVDAFQPFESFDNERLYYAQVANESVPYGKGELLLNAMGIRSRSALSRYRALLNLPDEIWEAADDHNVPEETLYNLTKLPPQEAVNQFWQIVLGQNSSSRSKAKAANHSPGTKRHFADLSRALRQTGPGKNAENNAALTYLQELRRWIDSEEQKLNRLTK